MLHIQPTALKNVYTVVFVNCQLLCATCFTGEGNGNPLQYSCLENPKEGGAW